MFLMVSSFAGEARLLIEAQLLTNLLSRSFLPNKPDFEFDCVLHSRGHGSNGDSRRKRVCSVFGAMNFATRFFGERDTCGYLQRTGSQISDRHLAFV